MKYSIILPYINRLPQLYKTLYSFTELYEGRKDFEVIVVEDSKNIDQMGLVAVLNIFREYFPITHHHFLKNYVNPAPLFNDGFTKSIGRFIILSSPECIHKTDILSGLDKEFKEDPKSYVVCACEKLNANDELVSWYQHSVHRNVQYHFCSALSAQEYINMGGFDDNFKNGYCFDDDDFRVRAIASLNLVTRDDLVVSHQWHSKDYISSSEKKELWKRNKRLFEDKHGRYSKPPNPKKIER